MSRQAIPMNMRIPSPVGIHSTMKRPRVLAVTTLPELCRLARIPMRVTGGTMTPVKLSVGRIHYSHPSAYYVAVGDEWKPTRTRALRAIEVLAFAFFDYAARECVCRDGYFRVPKRMGRPTVGDAPMTAAERMAKMRKRRRAVATLP